MRIFQQDFEENKGLDVFDEGQSEDLDGDNELNTIQET
jgi:hypothetical protein